MFYTVYYIVTNSINSNKKIFFFQLLYLSVVLYAPALALQAGKRMNFSTVSSISSIIPNCLLFTKQKTFSVFPYGRVSPHNFEFSQTSTSVSITYGTTEENVFYFFYKITRDKKSKRGNSLLYQSVNSPYCSLVIRCCFIHRCNRFYALRNYLAVLVKHKFVQCCTIFLSPPHESFKHSALKLCLFGDKNIDFNHENKICF